jgi:hypothetical protein
MTSEVELLQLLHTGGPNEDFFLFKDVLQLNSIFSPPIFGKVLSNNLEHDDVVMIDLVVFLPQTFRRCANKSCHTAKPPREVSTQCIEVFGRNGPFLVIVQR